VRRIEIPLKRKYTAAKRKGKYRADYTGHAGRKMSRRKLTARELALHEAQPVKVMVLLANGKRRMQTTRKAAS
jgi:hypothetical protein